jgi:hypothetical protein
LAFILIFQRQAIETPFYFKGRLLKTVFDNNELLKCPAQKDKKWHSFSRTKRYGADFITTPNFRAANDCSSRHRLLFIFLR